MEPYQIKDMIIDDHFAGEESVTAEFSYNDKEYSITFDKADLEIINTWVFERGTSFPANLSDSLIESIRGEVKKRI
ncbi:hypothetical protein [Halalkalibacter alkalisediminis]|uniref:Uncharacterized protein n=1 Tax=Halalkalibacter alkalisediminis TaxID=935616 RepID=A0ABV6NMT6_9BACI|nr:hypothetical protein [Halalkalibacter alkalisediminis]